MIQDKNSFYLIMTLVAIIVLAALLAACSPADAASCMTKVQARHHFRTSHLYWHTENHCWDATAGRRQHEHLARHHHRVAEPANHRRSVPVTVGDDRERQETPPLKASSPEVGSPLFAPALLPSWLDAMAAIPLPALQEPEADWIDRWPDMKPAEPRPLVVAAETQILSARNVIIAITMIVLCVAIGEVAFGGLIEQRRLDKRDGYFT
jgi:hypothetical protein